MSQVLFRLWIICTVLWGLLIAGSGVALWNETGSHQNNLWKRQGIFDARQSNDGQSRATDPSLSLERARQLQARLRAKQRAREQGVHVTDPTKQDLRDRNSGTVINVEDFGQFRIEGNEPTPAEEKIILEETERRKSESEAVSNNRLKLMLLLAGVFVIPSAGVLALGASLVWAFRGYRRTEPE